MSDTPPTPGPSSSPSGPPPTAAPVPKKTLKRRRTRSHNSSPSPNGRGFFVPGFDAAGSASSSLKQMTLSEVMDAAKGVSNMFLAHEIALDKNFTMKDLKAPVSPLEKQVKEQMHRAFWDILDAELKEDPPVYRQALNLLEEVKHGLLAMLVPQQKRVIDKINEMLDLELIAQQAENGALDFPGYASCVLDMMGMLCSQARDEEIAALRGVTDVVPLFKGIMKTLENMRMDFANYHIERARPLIISQSVEYEKTKFKQFLETQTDGLAVTRAWLKRHGPPEGEDTSDPRYHKLQVQRVLTDAFLELLEWDDFNDLPETLVMDHKRIAAIRDACERTAVSTAVILLTFSNVGGFVVPMDAQALKETLKKHADVLLEDFCDDTDLLKILPAVSAQVVKDVNDYLADKEKEQLPEATVRNLHEQILEMEDPNHRIRDLVQRRLVDFNKQAISAARSAPLQIPPGLTLCKVELAQIAGNFVRLVNYNRAVFGEFYGEIIENHVLFKPEAEEAAEGSSSSRARED